LYPTLLRAAQLADIHVINEAESKREVKFLVKIIFCRTRGKLLQPPSHSSPVIAKSLAAEKSFESILVAHPVHIIANGCDL